MSLDFRQDFLLNKSISLKQPVQGYKVAIDPVCLAASVDIIKEKILDVGCGVGAISLCLAYRFKQIKIQGIDIQKDVVALAQQNAIDNKCDDRVCFVEADLVDYAKKHPESYTIIVSNPPFFKKNVSNISPIPQKAIAHHDLHLSTSDWIKNCFKLLKSKGFLYIIFPFDDIVPLLESLQSVQYAIRIFPLWPRRGQGAKRVLIRFQKNSYAPSRLLNGLVLHQEDGSYTEEATKILRNGMSLVF